MVKKVTVQDYLRAVQKAVLVSYYAELVKKTPGKGIVADAWEVDVEDGNVIIVNREWGHVVNFLEYGTRPHEIKPKNAEALRWKTGTGDTFAYAKKVYHPGIEARKFVYNVMHDPTVRKRFEQALEKELSVVLN